MPGIKTTIDTLATMFDLGDSEKLIEGNLEYIAEGGGYAYSEAIKEGRSEEEAEKVREEAETTAQDEIYGNWHSGVESAAEELFGVHDIALQPVRKTERHPYEYRVVPARGKTWRDAADKIRQTINGMGPFWFKDLKEFLESGPYTPRQAVESHLGHVASYPEVYGTASAQHIFERSWR